MTTASPSFMPTLLLVLLSFASTVLAQTHDQFIWSFTQSLSTSLPTCQDLPVTVKPAKSDGSVKGIPPYYMMAFAPGKLPQTTFLGSDESNLKWTVNFPANTDLMLTVVDSNQSSGGLPPNLFKVVTGQSTQCIDKTLTATSSDFTVSANVTNALTTCDPWGLTIKGGVPPYKVTLAALNSPVVTNVTMGPTDDAFTFIDRADPNTKLVAAVSDLTNRWAFGTPLVQTQGSTNVDCIGLVSSSGSAAELKQEADARAAAARAQKQKRTAILAGVLTPLLLLLVGGGVFAFLFIRKRRLMQAQEKQQLSSGDAGEPKNLEEGVENIAVLPTATGPGGQVLSIASFIDNASATTRSPSASANTVSPTATVTSRNTNPFRSPSTISSTARDSLNSRASRPAVFANFPSNSIRGSAKAIEAGFDLQSPESTGEPSGALPSSDVAPGSGRWPVRDISLRAANPDDRSTPRPLPGEEMVYQHRDAGTVRELPPPYADSRSNQD